MAVSRIDREDRIKLFGRFGPAFRFKRAQCISELFAQYALGAFDLVFGTSSILPEADDLEDRQWVGFAPQHEGSHATQ